MFGERVNKQMGMRYLLRTVTVRSKINVLWKMKNIFVFLSLSQFT